MSGPLASTALSIARRYGVGGSSWTVRRASGSGVSGAKTWATVGSVTGYALRNAPDAQALALPQVTVASAPWRWVAPLGQPVSVQAEDVLISVADGRAFTVLLAPETDEGVVLSGLAPTQAPA